MTTGLWQSARESTRQFYIEAKLCNYNCDNFVPSEPHETLIKKSLLGINYEITNELFSEPDVLVSLWLHETWMIPQGFPLTNVVLNPQKRMTITLYTSNTRALISLLQHEVSLMTLFICIHHRSICAECRSGGNVLGAVTKQIWSLMCLIVWLWVSWWVWEHRRNHIQFCYWSRWTLELQVHILIFYIVSFLWGVWTRVWHLALLQSGTLWRTIIKDLM